VVGNLFISRFFKHLNFAIVFFPPNKQGNFFTLGWGAITKQKRKTSSYFITYGLGQGGMLQDHI
jgi:hypothetical protein